MWIFSFVKVFLFLFRLLPYDDGVATYTEGRDRGFPILNMLEGHVISELHQVGHKL